MGRGGEKESEQKVEQGKKGSESAEWKNGKRAVWDKLGRKWRKNYENVLERGMMKSGEAWRK